jgi:hypothetical protein
LSGLLVATPAQADFFKDRRQNNSWSRSRDYDRSSRSRDYDRDGIPNYRDRDDDNDGIRDSRDRNPYSSRRTEYYRYYRDGRYYSTPRRGPNGDLDRDGVRNRNDRDRDGDGRRNKRDDHPSDRRKR